MDEFKPLTHGANPILPSKRDFPERLVSMTGVSVRPGSAGPNEEMSESRKAVGPGTYCLPRHENTFRTLVSRVAWKHMTL